jgi:hypothetical protein
LINIKLSGIAGAIAFVMSFLLGIISGGRISMVFLKALIFAVIFATLSGGIYVLISIYLPDLLSPGDSEPPQDHRGSQVDILLDDQGGEGLNSDYSLDGNENSAEFGKNQGILNENIETLSGDGLDQNRQDEYTIGGDAEIIAGTPEQASSFTVDLAAKSADSVEELPDFDSMAAVFGGSSGGIPGTGAVKAAAPGESSGSLSETINAQFIGGPLKNKNTPELEEEFDVKEMASAIQTILKREDKG